MIPEKSSAPALLRKYGVIPDKRLGQNFLVDINALMRVVDSAEILPADTVLEIGAGLGSLTQLLAQSARRVIAVEVSPKMVEILHKELIHFDNVEIIQGDILRIDLADLFDAPVPAPADAPADASADASNVSQGYLVVANIPYYITSALFKHLLENARRPRRMVLTVQREVGERICAQPGEMSLLALSVQVYGSPQIAAGIPAAAFYPVPKVDSAVVRVDMYASPVIPSQDLVEFFRLAKAGFSQKRKMLRNALSAGMHCSPQNAQERLQAAGIEPSRRAETLSLEEWRGLVSLWKAYPDS